MNVERIKIGRRIRDVQIAPDVQSGYLPNMKMAKYCAWRGRG